MPGEYAPGEYVPGEYAPGEHAPGEHAPGEHAPVEYVPGDNAIPPMRNPIAPPGATRNPIAARGRLDRLMQTRLVPGRSPYSFAASRVNPSRVCGSLRPRMRDATTVRRIWTVPPPMVNIRASRTMRSSGRLRE